MCIERDLNELVEVLLMEKKLVSSIGVGTYDGVGYWPSSVFGFTQHSAAAV